MSKRDRALTKEETSLLKKLAHLGKKENAKVALKARQLLIAAHQPPYELRHNQVILILLAFVMAHDIYSLNCPLLLMTTILYMMKLVVYIHVTLI